MTIGAAACKPCRTFCTFLVSLYPVDVLAFCVLCYSFILCYSCVIVLSPDCTRNLKPAAQTRSQTVVSQDLKFPTSNQHLDTRLDVGLTSIRRLRFQTRVVQSSLRLPTYYARSTCGAVFI